MAALKHVGAPTAQISLVFEIADVDRGGDRFVGVAGTMEQAKELIPEEIRSDEVPYIGNIFRYGVNTQLVGDEGFYVHEIRQVDVQIPVEIYIHI